MRKILALMFSIIINLLLVGSLLVLKPSLEPLPPDTGVLLVFEEEEVEITQLKEPEPFAAFDESYFKGNADKPAPVVMPKKNTRDLEVAAPRLSALADAFQPELRPPDIVFEPAYSEELFIPASEELVLDFLSDEPDRGGEATWAGEEITWNKTVRTPLEFAQPEFPAFLREEGLEVDLELEITVSPAGSVVAVEVTRSSGFASIDVEVKKLASSWTFQVSASGEDDVARVTLHYRLEKSEL